MGRRRRTLQILAKRRYEHVRFDVRRHFGIYFSKLGLLPPVYAFSRGRPVRQITIFAPGTVGDVGMTSSITQTLRKRWPEARIRLVTHPLYVDVGRLNPDYDSVLSYGRPYNRVPIGMLGHRRQVRIAKDLTPDMDWLLLCQSFGWPAYLYRSSLLESYQESLKIPSPLRCSPRLRVPDEAGHVAAEMRGRYRDKAVLLAPEAQTIALGKLAASFWHRLSESLIDSGITVFCNSKRVRVSSEQFVAIGGATLTDAAALAVRCDAVISARSGFSDVVGFCSPNCPHRVLYPRPDRTFGRRSWLEWCSLRDMGVHSATECHTSLDTEADVDRELGQTLSWAKSSLAG